jgi:DNA-binding transcriptional LysR family regulator
MKFRFNDIQNFLVTATHKTLMQAASQLEISQPALSESLRRLEDDLGHVLFYRSRSGIELTPSGKVFLPKAQNLADAYHGLNIVVGKENLFGDRVITIGANPTVAQYSIPNTLAYLKANAPDYRIELVHETSRKVQEGVHRGKIDVGVVVNPLDVTSLVITHVEFDIVGVWSSGKNADPDTLICNPELLQTQEILRSWQNKPRKLIATSSLELICQLVNRGIGLGILPNRAVKISGLRLQHESTLPTYRDRVCLVHRPEFGRHESERLVLTALMHSVTGD